jgi:Secretion system C-terminal sorting domain
MKYKNNLFNLFFWAIIQHTIAQVPIEFNVGEGRFIKTTETLFGKSALSNPLTDVPVRNENGMIIEKDHNTFLPAKKSEMYMVGKDQASQKNYTRKLRLNNFQALGTNLDGMAYTGVTPSDPTICVGSNHVIQMINGPSGSYYQIYSKTGNIVKAKGYLDALTGIGGAGDPICLYDQFADRYILTEFRNNVESFGTPPNTDEGLVIAYSATNDPTGAWHIYVFGSGSNFPDYPKYSVSNNAIFVTSNNFNALGTYVGTDVWAINKTPMLSGLPSTRISLTLPGLNQKNFGTIPVRFDGKIAPPGNSGGFFAFMNDNGGSNADYIGLHKFLPNFPNPIASIFTYDFVKLQTLPFDEAVCSGDCIIQPPPGTNIDALEGRLMNQPVYRNFGCNEGIVMSNVVNAGANIAGIRWYELQKSGAENWSITQQSTYSPDNTHRFMSSISYEANGNIGLAYNVASPSIFPGIRYTGRKKCDPINTMTIVETTIIEGTTYHSITSNSNAQLNARYGDYNHLVIDPVDSSTFWFTAQYNNINNLPLHKWSTRITSFKLDPICEIPISLTATNLTTSSAIINWTSSVCGESYNVTYKKLTDLNWTNLATNITANSIMLELLSPATDYQWNIKVNCSSCNVPNPTTIAPTFKTLGSVALPLNLLSFYGSEVEGKTLLNWDTSFEKNINKFEIERSADAKVFVKIGERLAFGNKLKNEITKYNYTAFPLGLITYFRLKMVDNDGKIDYSKTIAIQSENTDNRLEIFPNPIFGDELSVVFYTNKISDTKIEIINQEGKVLIDKYLKTIIGKNMEFISLKTLLKGVYFVKIKSDNFGQNPMYKKIIRE